MGLLDWLFGKKTPSNTANAPVAASPAASDSTPQNPPLPSAPQPPSVITAKVATAEAGTSGLVGTTSPSPAPNSIILPNPALNPQVGHISSLAKGLYQLPTADWYNMPSGATLDLIKSCGSNK